MPPALKLTPKRHKAIVASVRNGAYPSTAAKAAGIGDSTLSDWMKRANDDLETDDRFRRLRDDIARAEAEAENDSAQILAKEKDWRAREAYLKRRFPSRWSEKVVEEHTGPGGGPIEHRGIALSEVLELARKAGVDVSQSPPADD